MRSLAPQAHVRAEIAPGRAVVNSKVALYIVAEHRPRPGLLRPRGLQKPRVEAHERRQEILTGCPSRALGSGQGDDGAYHDTYDEDHTSNPHDARNIPRDMQGGHNIHTFPNSAAPDSANNGLHDHYHYRICHDNEDEHQSHCEKSGEEMNDAPGHVTELSTIGTPRRMQGRRL